MSGQTAGPGHAEAFPRLRLRRGAIELLDWPWELPLDEWPADALPFRTLPVGPSRHLVRFVATGSGMVALKEEPLDIARREYGALRHLEEAGLPAVSAIGISEAAERDSAILVTEYLAHSLQYRRLFMRFPLGPGPYRDRLLDAMTWLLVDLHRGGVYWGDCSLANTLFRRDGDRIQAYLVDAETSEVHESLSDGQRMYDLDILVENVAYGLADLAALQNRPQDMDDAITAAEEVRVRYQDVWAELHRAPSLQPGDRQAVRARVRRLNELGFSVDELELEPGAPDGGVRLKLTVATRRFHARELRELTAIVALENQARLLLNDLSEYRAWLEWSTGKKISRKDAAERWLNEVFEPATSRIAAAVGPDRDIVQAYCDLLEHKWLLSEKSGRDVGLDAALESYLALGAPAPEDSAPESAGPESGVTETARRTSPSA